MASNWSPYYPRSPLGQLFDCLYKPSQGPIAHLERHRLVQVRANVGGTCLMGLEFEQKGTLALLSGCGKSTNHCHKQLSPFSFRPARYQSRIDIPGPDHKELL